MRKHHHLAAMVALSLVAMTAGPAAAVTMVATYTGQITSSVATSSFGGNLVGQTYTAIYTYDPSLGAASIYDPPGQAFDNSRLGSFANSPLKSVSLTVNGITQFMDMAALVSQQSQIAYSVNGCCGGAYVAGTASGDYTVNGVPTGSTDYQDMSTRVSSTTLAPFDLDQPFTGPVIEGASHFVRQVRNPGSGYDIAYDFRGDVRTFDIRAAASAAAVPEPAAWAMMIGGFGGVGAVMRARRRAMTLAA